ncbi:MAG: TonB family protein [Elusimicrobiales bacterium]
MMTQSQRSSRAFALSAAAHALLLVFYLKMAWAPESKTSLINSVDFIMQPERYTPPPPPKELIQIPTPSAPKAHIVSAKSPLALAKLNLSKQFVMPASVLNDARGKVSGPKRAISMDMSSGSRLKMADAGGLKVAAGPRIAQSAALEDIGMRRGIVMPSTIDVGGGRGGKMIGAEDALTMDDEPAKPRAKPAISEAPVTPAERKKRAAGRDEFGMMSGDYDIEGPLANRKILKRDAIPFPKWARGRPISEAVVSIKIWVTPEGAVMSTFRVMRTSGYADLDKYVTDELKKWVFEPLSPDEPLQKQHGIITIRFENK